LQISTSIEHVHERDHEVYHVAYHEA